MKKCCAPRFFRAIVASLFLFLEISSVLFSGEMVPLNDLAFDLRFSYERTSDSEKHPLWKSRKVDFEWGELQKDAEQVVLRSSYLVRTDPGDKRAYKLEWSETVFEAASSLTGISSVEIKTDPPSSIAEAKEIFRVNIGNVPQKVEFVFRQPLERSEPIWQSPLKKFQFLGFFSDGFLGERVPKAAAAETSIEGIIELASNRSISFEYQLDGGYFSRIRLMGEGILECQAKISNRAGQLATVYDYRDGLSVYRIRDSVELSNIDSSDVDGFVLLKPPKDGDKIVLMEEPHISAEWRDGKIVRLIDSEIAADYSSLKFIKPSSNFRFIAILVALAVTLPVVYWFTRSSKNGSQ